MGKKITAQAVGGDPVTFEQVNTVGELKAQMGLTAYTANVNGNPATDASQLPDFAYVSLAAPAKGGI